jgi:hypothetical protein
MNCHMEAQFSRAPCLLPYPYPQEDDLSRSVVLCKAEASTVSAWINFLEDTWKLQYLHEELKGKQAKYEGSH